jgi:hypothetical protein
MTHIIEVSEQELIELKKGKKFSLIKLKRWIEPNDIVVFENDINQHSATVESVQTAPGLMKGYVLLTLEN